jgi:transcriptional regulator with XRE-family HTH domain
VDTSMNAPPPSSSQSSHLLSGLGQALRWLREKQSRKQYRVADLAGITKGMLSAYETGRQRPSLDTLEKLLETLGCDLNGLHNALQLVNGRPELVKSWRGWQGWPGAPASAGTVSSLSTLSHSGVINESGEPYQAGDLDDPERPGGLGGAPWAGDLGDLRRVLGTDQPRLAEEEERALGQMLAGFHGLLRYWHRSLQALPATDRPISSRTLSPPRPSPGLKREPHQPPDNDH